jgi:hypothetical protein
MSGRSQTNPEEVQRVTQLVAYLLMNNVQPSEISVLAAYQGQVTLIRKSLKDMTNSHPELFPTHNGFISTNTIDMFQGDQNKYILVSLVRSNQSGHIGFLADLSRRCVAQSRAQCGMYFIGNTETLSVRRQPWTPLITGMSRADCVGTGLPLQCRKHLEKSVSSVENAKELKKVVENPGLVCKFKCGEDFSCGLHKCSKPCIPDHSHGDCMTLVTFKFIRCGHHGQRRCHQDQADVECNTTVSYPYVSCRHVLQVACHNTAQYVTHPPLCTQKVHLQFYKPDCHRSESSSRVIEPSHRSESSFQVFNPRLVTDISTRLRDGLLTQ